MWLSLLNVTDSRGITVDYIGIGGSERIEVCNTTQIFVQLKRVITCHFIITDANRILFGNSRLRLFHTPFNLIHVKFNTKFVSYYCTNANHVISSFSALRIILVILACRV